MLYRYFLSEFWLGRSFEGVATRIRNPIREKFNENIKTRATQASQ